MRIPVSKIKAIVTRNHCKKVFELISKKPIPKNRDIKDYYIKYKDKNSGVLKPYPVKYVIEEAYNLASKELGLSSRITSYDFESTQELRDFIKTKLGFDVFK